MALAAMFVERFGPASRPCAIGRFDAAGWAARQVTTGSVVRLELADGPVETVRALGVDATTGALLVEDPAMPDGRRRPSVVGEIRHVRLADPIAGGV